MLGRRIIQIGMNRRLMLIGGWKTIIQMGVGLIKRWVDSLLHLLIRSGDSQII